MLLLDVKEENGWLFSTFQLTYKVSWERLCHGVRSIMDYYDQPEIFLDGNKLELINKNSFAELEEGSQLMIRGMSTILRVPIMITFYNQLPTVSVSVAAATEEYETADYKSFNLSLGQYMDSIELAMHR